MNRNGGGTTEGTFIIGYSCGDSNNTFQFMDLSLMCGHGVVTPTCPFTDTSFDRSLDGSPIVAIEDYSHGWCGGTSASNTFTLRLEICPDGEGTGGGWNSTYVAPGSGDDSDNCVISIHATNTYSSGSNMYNIVSAGRSGGLSITTGSRPILPDCGPAPSIAQWYQIFGSSQRPAGS
jgi:hypothetical protein